MPGNNKVTGSIHRYHRLRLIISCFGVNLPDAGQCCPIGVVTLGKDAFKVAILASTLPHGHVATRSIHGDRGIGLDIGDIGIGGDGLRGPVTDVVNPHRTFLAHSDAPEVYGPDGVLKDGGKHYGHIEVNIDQGPGGQWRAQLDAVYIFPLMDADGHVMGFERRLYDDSYTLHADKLE